MSPNFPINIPCRKYWVLPQTRLRAVPLMPVQQPNLKCSNSLQEAKFHLPRTRMSPAVCKAPVEWFRQTMALLGGMAFLSTECETRRCNNALWILRCRCWKLRKPSLRVLGAWSVRNDFREKSPLSCSSFDFCRGRNTAPDRCLARWEPRRWKHLHNAPDSPWLHQTSAGKCFIPKVRDRAAGSSTVPYRDTCPTPVKLISKKISKDLCRYCIPRLDIGAARLMSRSSQIYQLKKKRMYRATGDIWKSREKREFFVVRESIFCFGTIQSTDRAR